MVTNASSSTLRKPRQFESESEIMEPGIDQNKPDVDQSLSFLHSQQKIDSSNFASVSQLSLFGKFSRFFFSIWPFYDITPFSSICMKTPELKSTRVSLIVSLYLC